MNEPPFDDPLVRQAFAHAINREAINEVLFFDAALVADGILPPHSPGTTSPSRRIRTTRRARRSCSRSPATPTTCPASSSPSAVAAATRPTTSRPYQQQWRGALGVEVEIEAIEWSAYLRELRRGTFQMYSAGWIADYPDPENFIGKLFASDSPHQPQQVTTTLAWMSSSDEAATLAGRGGSLPPLPGGRADHHRPTRLSSPPSGTHPALSGAGVR